MAAPNLPAGFASDREWAVPDALEIKRYGALSTNWAFTKGKVAEIKAALNGGNLPNTIVTLAVAGSLGRMDAAADVSDCDLLVVLSDTVLKNENEANATYERVWDVLKPLNLKSPKPT